jgi:hypothetical protein
MHSEFLWLPRRIKGEWRWLTSVRYRWVFGGGGLYGECWKEYD